MDISELVKKVASQISTESSKDCEGCVYAYASFRDHSCYNTPWDLQVILHYKRVLNHLQIEDQEGLEQKVNQYGPSFH